jgi:hypothetical protein
MISYKLGEMFLLDPSGLYCRDPQLETVFILKLINIVDEDGNSIFDKGNNIVSAIAYEDGGKFEGVFLNTITQETVVIKKELLFRPGALVNIEEYLKVIDVTKKIYVNRVENFDITDKVIEALDLVLTSSIRNLVKARTRNEQLYNAICEMETHINELRRLKLCRYTNKALINITEKDKKIFTDLNMMNEFYKLTDMIKEVRKGEDTLVYCRDDVLQIYDEVEDAPPDGTEYASFVYTDPQNLIIKCPSLKNQVNPLNYPLNPFRIKCMGIRATENEKWLKSYY